jgi:uncharacterized membrane protein YkvA (DUF1232 family)
MSRLRAVIFMMRDKTVPRRKKALVIGGIIYLFFPIDLIPPVLFPIALIDDMIVWLWILWHLRDVLDTYWLGKKEVDFSKRYSVEKIISDAEFEVEKDPK